jgi:asparagine synthase (glutamine-hydrolysing)
MLSVSGRYAMVFNGEVYNFSELRRELEAEIGPQSWSGTSDTEILLACIERRGLEDTLKRSQGMFAIGLWDRQRRVLSLARDRLGKKPVYWGRVGGHWAFASEPKAFTVLPGWTGELNSEAWPHYFRNGFVPAPLSAFAGIQKLPAGSWVELSESAATEPRSYWSLDPVHVPPFEGSFDEAVSSLETLLDDSVRCRMVADVPLGAFLSGGIDSTLVVSTMVRHASRPVKTYTIGFEEEEYDESPYAKALANHLGTEHHEERVRAADALDLVPQIASWFDEPFADSSQIPTFWVSRWARSDVTVALSGDGGDESFGGYSRYAELSQAVNGWGRWPAPVVWAAGTLLGAASGVNPAFRNRGRLLRSLPGGRRDQKIYRYLMAHFKQPADILRDNRETDIDAEKAAWSNGIDDPVLRAMYDDTLVYLPDDVLVKVDRTSMAVSLEARAPLLDYRVVEFAWSLPKEYRWTPQGGKRVLRALLERRVPTALLDRPKKGFSLPVGPWLKGPLRPWAEELLSPSRLEASGILNSRSVRRLWGSFQAGQHDWSAYLWDVLIFQSWLDHGMGRSA